MRSIHLEEISIKRDSLLEFKNLIVGAGLKLEEIQPLDWDYGLTRDYSWFRQLERRKPKFFQGIVRVCRAISPFSCAHMVMIIARKPLIQE